MRGNQISVRLYHVNVLVQVQAPFAISIFSIERTTHIVNCAMYSWVYALWPCVVVARCICTEQNTFKICMRTRPNEVRFIFCCFWIVESSSGIQNLLYGILNFSNFTQNFRLVLFSGRNILLFCWNNCVVFIVFFSTNNFNMFSRYFWTKKFGQKTIWSNFNILLFSSRSENKQNHHKIY